MSEDYANITKSMIQAALYVFITLFLMVGCSGKKKVHDQPAHFEPAANALETDNLFSKKMPGLVADLNVTRDGKWVLLSTIPNPEEEADPVQYRSILMSPEGKKKWTRDWAYRIKSQAISKDGSLAVLVNYNDEILGLGADGKTLWTVPGNCKPYILSALKKWVCYHDDDVAPGIAFEVYDWAGKQSFVFKAPSDILALKHSYSEESLVIGLNHGLVSWFGSDLKMKREKKLNGEILDISISSGPHPRIAALVFNSTQGQRLMLIDEQGKALNEVAPQSHYEQVEFSADGLQIILYGNGPQGQNLMALSNEAKSPSLKTLWQQNIRRHADYSSPLTIRDSEVLVGIEDLSPDSRISDLVAFDFSGKMTWSIPVQSESGAFLFSAGVSNPNATVAVASDEATLNIYRLEKK